MLSMFHFAHYLHAVFRILHVRLDKAYWQKVNASMSDGKGKFAKVDFVFASHIFYPSSPAQT